MAWVGFLGFWNNVVMLTLYILCGVMVIIIIIFFFFETLGDII